MATQHRRRKVQERHQGFGSAIHSWHCGERKLTESLLVAAGACGLIFSSTPRAKSECSNVTLPITHHMTIPDHDHRTGLHGTGLLEFNVEASIR